MPSTGLDRSLPAGSGGPVRRSEVASISITISSTGRCRLGTTGDVYDRYLVRMEEMRQSLAIVEQALDDLPDGPVNVDDWSISPPPKDRVYNTIEGMVAHFKLTFEGVQVPPGEVYSYTEGGNGELGFYLVSEGGGQPAIMPRPLLAPIRNRTVARGVVCSDIVALSAALNVIDGGG